MILQTESEGVFTSPFLGLLNRGRQEKAPNREPPEWLLGFSAGSTKASLDFLKSVYTTLLKNQKHPERLKPDFHSETGVYARCLYYYLKDLPSIDATIRFFTDVRSYARGETAFLPEFAGGNEIYYERLKLLENTAYTYRLIEEYEQNGRNSSCRTQDFTLFHRVPTLPYIETVVCSLTSAEVIKFLEEYRI